MSIGQNIVDIDNLPAPIIINSARFNDISNTYINGILFLYPCERRNKRLLWLCKCTCGNYFKVDAKSIRSGNTKSCGCRFLQRMREYNTRNSEDLSGQQFDKLYVLNKTDIKNNRQYYLCQCECGNLHETDRDSLVQHKIHSCGCLKSYMEYKLAKDLRENHIQFKQQFTFDDCRNKKDNLLYYDFAIFYNKKLIGLIEY